MKIKVINIIFICCILAVLFAGLGKTVFFPKDVNDYENRYAEKIAPVSLSGYLDGSFQDSMENALADQIPLAQPMKKLYNDTTSAFLKNLLNRTVVSEENARYITLGDKNIFGDNYIVFNPSRLEYLTAALDERSAAYNELFKQYPDVEFFLYYIEKDTDINFETGEQVGAFEYLKERLELPDENTGCFEVNSFEDFASSFYRTDHHWKAEGAYSGYRDVLAMLCPSEIPLEKVREDMLPGTFSGSKAQGSEAGSFSESFSVYRYDFPEMTVSCNGAPVPDYGQQEAYKNGGEETPSYGIFYGGDMGELIFDTQNDDKEDILIIGESYDNAILKLLASHFGRTYSIDLRYYQPYMAKDFHLSEYIAEHDIKKVLLIGNIDYYIYNEFFPEN